MRFATRGTNGERMSYLCGFFLFLFVLFTRPRSDVPCWVSVGVVDWTASCLPLEQWMPLPAHRAPSMYM
jgi:hypothetical protein